MPTENAVQYDSMRVRTTSLKGLVCLLHDRALAYIKKGMDEGNRRDIEKAQNLIFQLEIAVNKDEDASRVLADLYAYSYYLLERSDAGSVIAARRIIETLSEAFSELASYKKKSKS